MRLDEKTLHLDNTTYSTKYSYVEGAKANSTTMLLAGIQNGSDAAITYTYDARGNISLLNLLRFVNATLAAHCRFPVFTETWVIGII